jgi:uncharacterized membrane protein SirB2
MQVHGYILLTEERVNAYSHKLCLNLDAVLFSFTGYVSAVKNKSGVGVVLKIVISVISFLLIVSCIYLVIICKPRGRTRNISFL